MGKSLIIKGADFSENGIRVINWNIDYTGEKSVYSGVLSSFNDDNGTPLIYSLFGSEQDIRFIEFGIATSYNVLYMPTSIRVYKINRSTNKATYLTTVEYPITEHASTEKIVIDLGSTIHLGTDETIGFYALGTNYPSAFMGYELSDSANSAFRLWVNWGNHEYPASDISDITINSYDYGNAYINIKFG